MLLVLSSTADNERGPRYCEQVFANLSRYPFTLLVAPIDGAASLAIECKAKHQHAIARELKAAYPDLRLRKKPSRLKRRVKTRSLKLRLFRSHFQLRTYEEFWNESDRTLTDPAASLLTAVAPQDDMACVIELRCKPARFHSRWWFRRTCQRKASEKGNHQLYRCQLRLLVSAADRKTRFARERLNEMCEIFGQFVSGTPTTFYAWPFGRFWLNETELATLWHPTTSSVRARTMQTNDSRDLEAPLSIGNSSEEGTAILGKLSAQPGQPKFGIKPSDRRRMMSVFGKTGMGKSTLLHQMIVSDMKTGRGVGVVCPHGDLADAVLESVPRSRTGDVVLLDATDRDFPPAYEPLHGGGRVDASLTASGVVSAFKKLYGYSWGPRLEHILRYTVLALLEVDGTSLVSLTRMLSDSRYRESIAHQVQDPLVRSFWLEEFANKPSRWQEEAIAPIQNKAGAFLASPILRSIVGQVPSKIDLREVMDNGKILIVNLSKGSIGEDASTLLGALLVTGIQQAAMSRSDIDEDKRRDFYLYVDEFGSFQTDAFSTAFSELRKYRLNLVTANQFIAQLEPTIRDSLLGNVGSILCFQLGIEDAELMAQQMGGDLKPLDLISLPKYRAYARLLVDGMPSKPFSMETIPPKKNRRDSRSDKTRRASRRRYARPIADVQQQVARQLSAL